MYPSIPWYLLSFFFVLLSSQYGVEELNSCDPIIFLQVLQNSVIITVLLYSSLL